MKFNIVNLQQEKLNVEIIIQQNLMSIESLSYKQQSKHLQNF